MSVIIPVILCGGSGTRLWPLSRRDRPKQLVSLVGDETLLEATLRRAGALGGSGEIICVTAADYGAEVRQSLSRMGQRGRLLLEPEPRNTAPALTAAALLAARIDPEAIVVALPADHFIDGDDAFVASVARACAAAERGWLTILGVRPRHPSPAFGYIVPDGAIAGQPGVARVRHFIEKPTPEVALGLIEAGALWNAGIVVGRADHVIAAVQKHEPSVLAAVERSLKAGESGPDGLRLDGRAFAAAPSISFDKAVLERHEAVAQTLLESVWRDVGTWGEVAELYAADGGGNRHRGRVHLSASQNSFVFSPHRLTVGIGLADLVVIDTPDALLVANRKELGRVREVVEAMAAAHYPEVEAGKLRGGEVIREAPAGAGGAFQTRHVSVRPGEVIRREPQVDAARHWIVLAGSVQVTVGGAVSTYEAPQSFHVLPGNAHRLANRGALPAELIEVILTREGAG